MNILDPRFIYKILLKNLITFRTNFALNGNVSILTTVQYLLTTIPYDTIDYINRYSLRSLISTQRA